MARFVAVDLFAGAGGMSLGAQLAGIHIALAVESDPHAAKTYAANHPGTAVFDDDIRRLSAHKLDAFVKTPSVFGVAGHLVRVYNEGMETSISSSQGGR